MKELAILITEMVNQFHDAFISLCEIFGIHLTDKEMHFWVIGIFGIFFFGVTHAVFTWLSKWSMTALSFIYTVTVIIVIVFAIEIQQKVTGRGNMEFLDATEGIKGFLVFFMFFLLLKMLLRFIKILFSGRPTSKSNGNARSRR
ncbi:hypothetical protein ACFVIX_16230 [Bacillus subtilis]|uniref:Uncharacterized protein n=1 Tax=Bacillus subtilis subsp. subtilis TaxID=135461 RepID=A0ABD4A0V2_BACIU|nr:hypothetical protein [Bacillus subtilis]KIL33937.1 hypothetical protein B4067_1557 [Bacillus subtilis subsp. subtilis]KIN59693.1 hypothetical protein B4145_1481 [Bacillus subtilis]MED1675776.1 hypothetical protein [Bacillus subtilis]POD86841.1 uncharacterized protein S101384_02025 [Bacillus subtilis subsp. subtilis]WBC27726.1 hypothetical protein O6U12_09865 [Bacillus subtilis]